MVKLDTWHTYQDAAAGSLVYPAWSSCTGVVNGGPVFKYLSFKQPSNGYCQDLYCIIYNFLFTNLYKHCIIAVFFSLLDNSDLKHGTKHGKIFKNYS